MIRPANTGDFEFIFGLYMHPQVNPFLLYERMERPPFRPIFEDLLEKSCLFVYETGSQPAGMCKLLPLQHRTHHVVYLGGVAIDPGFASKGHGTRLLQDIIGHCRDRGFLRIELSVAVHNRAAIRLYEKSGFRREGILKKYSHMQARGEYWDEVLMAYLFPFPGDPALPR